MPAFAEQRVEIPFRQHVGVRVYVCIIDPLRLHQTVAHLVRRITQLYDKGIGARGDPFEADGKTIAAQDRENHSHRPGREFRAHIGGNLFNRRVVPLRPRDNSLRNAYYIVVIQCKPRFFTVAQQ
jgi:hypothetical protein